MWMGLIQSEQGLKHHDIKEEREKKTEGKEKNIFILAPAHKKPPD